MRLDDHHLLRLLHLADSTLPIGTIAHSFGLETRVAEGDLSVEQLEPFLQDYLNETGGMESTCCRLSYRLTSLPDTSVFEAQWLSLNEQMSAWKTARESRSASATLGRRLLQLALELEAHPAIKSALLAAQAVGGEVHYSSAFGFIGGILGIDESAVVVAYLRQFLAGLVSCCQRLMPLGQSQAGQILWRLYPTLITVARRSEAAAPTLDNAVLFTPLPDLGSMRHPRLTTRLFIS
jgi:urease accessory protein